MICLEPYSDRKGLWNKSIEWVIYLCEALVMVRACQHKLLMTLYFYHVNMPVSLVIIRVSGHSLTATQTRSYFSQPVAFDTEFHTCNSVVKGARYTWGERERSSFSLIFWNNCTDLVSVVPWGSHVSAINTLWASSVVLSGLGLIYRCCMWLSQGGIFLTLCGAVMRKNDQGRVWDIFNEQLHPSLLCPPQRACSCPRADSQGTASPWGQSVTWELRGR